MIYWELFLGFLKIGCFSFGGAYSAIPLIRDVVLDYGWLTSDEITYMIAVSESTPGPIMVNLATYVGSTQAGLLGSVLATLTVVLPAFLIIVLITTLLKAALKNMCFQAVLDGLKNCISGIILATGLWMVLQNCGVESSFDQRALILSAAVAAVMILYRKVKSKRISPIPLILISAVLGVVVYGV